VKLNGLRHNTKSQFARVLLTALFLIILSGLLAVPAQAQTPAISVTQEDPAEARVIFNGLSLLVYYSSSLEPVMLKDYSGAQQALEIMPFANVPESLSKATSAFAGSSISLAGNLAALFQLWDTQNELVRKNRLGEALEIFRRITAGLPEVSGQLAAVRLAVEQTASFLKIKTAGPDSELSLVYAEIQSKMDRLEKMLDLLKLPVFSANGDTLKLLEPTVLTLKIDSLTAYVGDNISFQGTLTSTGQPLAAREIAILINDNRFATAQTSENGEFEGALTLPYWYQPDLKMQALYYPLEEDINRFLSSSSAVVRLSVLFYPAALTLTPAGRVYPGRTLIIHGVFDYGQAPAIERAATRVYLDDAFLTGFAAATVFDLPLNISTALTTGRHALTIYAPAAGRYAPVSTSQILEVVLAPTSLDLKLPVIGLTPGSFKLSGRAYSDLGPLQDAALEFRMEDNSAAVTTAESGDFTTRLNIAPGFNLLGTQTVTIRVQPREAWNDSVTVTKSLFIINWISCGSLFLILLGLAVILPRRIQNRSLRRPAGLFASPAIPSPAPLDPGYNVASDARSRDKFGEAEKSPDSIFGRYRLALELMQKVTKSVLKPQQTLREYGALFPGIYYPDREIALFKTSRRPAGCRSSPPAFRDAPSEGGHA
jgi:hypothetical protein